MFLARKLKWILVIILGISVFAGAVFGAYKFGQRQVKSGPQPTPTPVVVATPTPDPTANWKTYTNTKYGYSIDYPNNWRLEEKSVSGYLQSVSFGKKDGLLDTTLSLNYGDKLGITSKGELKNCQSWMEDRIKEDRNAVEVFEVGGLKIFMDYTGRTGKGTEGFDRACFEKAGRTYEFMCTHNMDPGVIKTCRLMLSTFRFLPEVSPTPESAEGKFCGGIAANLPENQCPTDYRCQLDGNYPDTGGKCVKE